MNLVGGVTRAKYELASPQKSLKKIPYNLIPVQKGKV
jgi:hypothetical protein